MCMCDNNEAGGKKHFNPNNSSSEHHTIVFMWFYVFSSEGNVIKLEVKDPCMIFNCGKVPVVC